MMHALVLEFDRASFEFSRGVEIGRLWEQFKSPGEFDQMICSENAEMIMRIVESTGRMARAEHTEDPAWMHLLVEEQFA